MSTIIQQGKFTSDGTATQIAIRSDVDWMEVINYTQMATQQTPGRGVKFEWQRGMAAGTGVEFTKADGADTLQGEVMASGGFTLLDTSDQTPGAAVTGTTITKAAPPVCTATAHGFQTNDIVRIYSSDTMDQINGLEFSVTRTGANTFTLTNMNTNTANFTQTAAFSARKIPFNPQFYPRNRVITRISAASSAIVTMAVTHGFTAGQKVRLKVPSDFGMVQADNVTATITAIGAADVDGYTNTITLDLDTSAFTAFAWPASSAAPLTFAQVVPIGEAASESYANLLDDATDNQSVIGMELGGGVDGPAGSSNDVIYWKAGKSVAVTNE